MFKQLIEVRYLDKAFACCYLIKIFRNDAAELIGQKFISKNELNVRRCEIIIFFSFFILIHSDYHCYEKRLLGD